ncbi:MAG: rhomboid family intramembrane serine protease [Lachnospiraceae bacterium]|nr:rhomboid family intramembrane serine protease [Lachnospiraceae bacterium]
MNTILVAINVLMFFVMLLSGAIGDSWEMVKWGAMFTPLMKENHEYYRLLTAVFLHFDIEHLTGNMIILAALGDNLERALGKIRYLIVYLVSGLGASICSFLYNEIIGDISVSAGASGAIFGVIGALFCMVLINKGKLEDITATRLGLMIVYILYTGFTTPQVDNAAHIGGLLTGMLLTGLLHINTRKGRRKHED